MLHDPKTFEMTTARPIAFATAEERAAERQDLRDQDKALALMLTYVGVLILSTWMGGVEGLVGWGLTSAALAGLWVLYTCVGIRAARQTTETPRTSDRPALLQAASSRRRPVRKRIVFDI